MKRRLFTILSAFSLLLFVAVAAAWPFTGGQLVFRSGPAEGRQADLVSFNMPGLSYSRYTPRAATRCDSSPCRCGDRRP